MLRKILDTIESKRGAKSFGWALLVKIKDFLWSVLTQIVAKTKNTLSLLSNTFKWMFAPKKYPIPFIPFKLFSSYTMNGNVKIRYMYLNGKNGRMNDNHSNVYRKEEIDSYIGKIKEKKTFYYGKTDAFLYEALEKFSIKNKEVAIMGSEEPLYESICLYFGGKPITIEYKKIIVKDERLRTMTVEEYDANPIKFDAAFSVSSFEHDGLGRYGDPLDPNGDLKAMKKMKSIIKPGGLLFLAVPIGADALFWNAHRIYGKYRLPLLLKGWEIIGSFGFSDNLLLNEDYKNSAQPIFVLKNSI